MREVPRNRLSFAWVLILALGLAACSSGPPRSYVPVYTVKRGDTVYSIAWRYNIDFKELAGWNGITSPYTIYPGQRLRMGPSGRTSTQVASSSSPASPAPPRASAKPAAAPRKPAASASSSTAGPVTETTWIWPTEGQVIRAFSSDAAGKKGIAIAGTAGQPVRASADGEVVYSGGGLIGYGQLIIVNHNKNYLSAYAHNQRILVKEGDKVTAGQQIAEMGSTGADRPMLHFEIRRNGKPVDPLKYLPKR